MAIEIGNLVVKGTFGRPNAPVDKGQEHLEERLTQLHRDILADVREIMADAARLARER